MSTTPRHLPRFIPTLTEIVDSASFAPTDAKTSPDLEAMVNLVQSQLKPVFERRLQEEIDRVVRAQVAKQWAEVGSRLQGEMQNFVRQAVIDALASQRQHTK
jgi:hypothetical protein